jgi:hypothetical protein
LTFILLIGFVLFYSRFAFFLGYANLVQYATFMAARAYQSGTRSQDQQVDAARSVLVSLLKKSEGLAGQERFKIAEAVGGGDLRGALIGPGDRFVAKDDGYSWQQGVRYSFRGKMIVSLLGDKPSPMSAVNGEAPGVVRLTSESWLGREPTEDECLQELKSKGLTEGPDNGC